MHNVQLYKLVNNTCVHTMYTCIGMFIVIVHAVYIMLVYTCTLSGCQA